MDRNNGRFTYIRRPGQGQQHHNQHHQTSSSLSNTSQSSISSGTSNNNQHQHLDNHRNSSSNSSSSSQFSSNTSVYSSSSPSNISREPITQHDELIRYIKEAWTKVTEPGNNVFYCNESDNQLKNFKPFNLEEYWGQRLVQNLHVTHGHQ